MEGRRAYEMFDRKEDGELEAAIAAGLETWSHKPSSLRLDLRPDKYCNNSHGIVSEFLTAHSSSSTSVRAAVLWCPRCRAEKS
jgi:hypothetical protein